MLFMLMPLATPPYATALLYWLPPPPCDAMLYAVITYVISAERGNALMPFYYCLRHVYATILR